MQHLQNFELKEPKDRRSFLVIGVLVGLVLTILGVLIFSVGKSEQSARPVRVSQASLTVSKPIQSSVPPRNSAAIPSSQVPSEQKAASSEAPVPHVPPTPAPPTSDNQQVAIQKANDLANQIAQSYAKSAKTAGDEVNFSTHTP